MEEYVFLGSETLYLKIRFLRKDRVCLQRQESKLISFVKQFLHARCVNEHWVNIMKKSFREVLLRYYPRISEFEDLHSTFFANCTLSSFLCYTRIMLNIVTIQDIKKKLYHCQRLWKHCSWALMFLILVSYYINYRSLSLALTTLVYTRI